MRIFVAVAAAYALVLQLTLTGLLAAQAAAASPEPSICYAAGGGEHAPAAAVHQGCAVCAVAPGIALPPPIAAPHVAWLAATIGFQPVGERSAPPQRLHSPRCSQGPPRAA